MTVHACQSQSPDISRLATVTRLAPVPTYFVAHNGRQPVARGVRRLTGKRLPVVPPARRLPGRASMRRRKMRRLCDWRLATGSRLASPGLGAACCRQVG
eukprot:scaffold36305_cov35-Cyclotella_meneghiniana.AAC.10